MGIAFFAALLLLLMVFTSCGRSMLGEACYVADEIQGKLDWDGWKLESTEQYDTKLSDVALYLKNGEMTLSFMLDGEKVVTSGYLIEPTVADFGKEAHYVFSPKNFEHPTYDFTIIKITTAADISDLVTSDPTLVGKPVLTIQLATKDTQEWCIWQGELTENVPDAAKNCMSLREAEKKGLRSEVFSEEEYNKIRNAANERWMFSRVDPQPDSGQIVTSDGVR